MLQDYAILQEIYCMSLQLFFGRLRQERDARGLTQDAMALKVGVSKRSYCAYEAGETAPSAKLLAALAEMGIDVSYLLTGVRVGGAAPAEPPLARDEEILLDNYRNSPPDAKAVIKAASDAAARTARGAKRDKAA